MQFLGSSDKFGGGTLNLALYVKLITLYLNVASDNQSEDALINEILNNLLESILIADFGLDTELAHILAFALKSSLYLIRVEESLSLDFSSVGLQKNVSLSIFEKLLGEVTCSLKIVLIEKCSRKFSEIVTVDILFSQNDWKCY